MGKGLEYALLAVARQSRSKRAPFYIRLFFFLGGGRGFYLRSVAPSAPKPPTYPTARERWRHSFADAKRREFKFCIFRVRVSAGKI